MLLNFSWAKAPIERQIIRRAVFDTTRWLMDIAAKFDPIIVSAAAGDMPTGIC